MEIEGMPRNERISRAGLWAVAAKELEKCPFFARERCERVSAGELDRLWLGLAGALSMVGIGARSTGDRREGSERPRTWKEI